MEIVEKNIDEITPDPKQPRTVFRQEDIVDLASSLEYDYKTGTAHKMINPIEIDKDGVIITGEQRWKAAKLAGWKTVPIKVVDPGDATERFIRQVKENVNRGTMTAIDEANAFKTIQDNLQSTSQVKLHQPKEGITRDERIREVARVIGTSDTYVADHLKLLLEDLDIQQAIVDEKIGYTVVAEANAAPKEYRKELKDRMLRKELSTRGLRVLANALTRNPEKAKELLSHNYKDKNIESIVSIINDIAPSSITQIVTGMEKVDKIIRMMNNLTEIINSSDKTQVSFFSRPTFAVSLNNLQEALKRFFEEKQTLKGGELQDGN